MPPRVVNEKSRSLYLNLPKSVSDAMGLKAGDSVEVRFVEGIGIIVQLPILMPRIYDKRGRCGVSYGSKSGNKNISIDPDFCQVIPLYDSPRRSK